jgi:hypothetical protein
MSAYVEPNNNVLGAYAEPINNQSDRDAYFASFAQNNSNQLTGLMDNGQNIQPEALLESKKWEVADMYNKISDQSDGEPIKM